MKKGFEKKLIRKALSSSSLLKNLSEESLDFVMESGMILEFEKGYVLDIDRHGLVFILQGCVRVEKNGTTLNILRNSDVFGFTSMFVDKKVKTSIVMNERTVLFVINQNSIEELIRKDSDFAMAYITFLTNKICFLNNKISCFTTDNAENKVIGYIASISCPGDEAVLPVNMVNLASSLNISRASLYRVFDSLESKGIISRSGNKIKIMNKDALVKMREEL